MKPIIFCGYRRRGKTTFIKRLIPILKSRGHSVSVVKHIGHRINLEDADTTRYLKEGADASVGFGVGYTLKYEYRKDESDENLKFIRYKLHSILMGLRSEFILIEGLKSYEGPIPKIVFGSTEDEVEELIDEMTIAYTGIEANDYGLNVPYLPYDMPDDRLYEFINENSIPFVADLDCGECGYPTCREFAKNLMAGKVNIKMCAPMSGDVSLTINNKPVYLKGFVRDVLKDIIHGFVKNLHDYEEGTIKITVKK